MYILGGKLKGRKLAGCRSKAIRPVMSLVRKSIFDTLNNFVKGASVLDLFAGTGVLGIEAMSRGASDLTLVDSSRDSYKLIKKNIAICSLKATVISGQLPESLLKGYFKGRKYNLIFIDPPYEMCFVIEDVLKALLKKDLVASEGLIFIETRLKDSFLIPKGFNIVKEKKYGGTKVTILQV